MVNLNDMKSLTNSIKQVMLMVASGIILLACLSSCKREHINYNTTSTVNMYDYLAQNPAKFSLFKQIVDKAGYTSFLNTYGTYTLFAPTNDGVNAYLKAQGKANIDAIDAATAKGLVSIALIADTIGSQFFSDGKLRTPTTIGQYLITGSVTKNGIASTVINKQANLITANVLVGNGIVHIIDNVLMPATITLAKTIEQNSKYSIFTAALKATGFYDSINVASADNPDLKRKYLTVIGETDSVFKAAGIADYNALKAKYSTKGDPTNHADSLWLFVGYHIWSELSYLSDIAVLNSHATLAPLEITTSQLVGSSVLLNNDTFNGVLEPGQQLYRPNSDVSANNGVFHSSLANYTIKVRFPSPVYFDVCAQPEIIRTPGLYRSGKSLPFVLGTLSNVYMEGQGGAGNGIVYVSDVTPFAASNNNYYYNGDHLEANSRWRVGSNGLHVLEFTTPVIVKGTYKIWIDYKQNNAGTVSPVYFDGASLPNTWNNADALNGNETDAQAESRGYKSYSDAPVTTTLNNAYYGFVGRFMGIVTIKTTDHHKIRMETTANSNGNPVLALDVIEFRPVNMDQVHPRLGRNGNLVP
jgi:uncharacterized surface protein with fasciclin (FAS1) repeats